MDKKNQTKKGSFFASRRFRYGALATVFTAVFIAAVILLNVLVSAVDSKFSLYIDLTKDKVLTIQESSVKTVREELDLFREQTGADCDITITFLQARDTLVVNQQSKWVVTLAESYAEEFPEIHVEFKEDLMSHPERYTKYNTISSGTVIVSTEGNYDTFTLDSCLVYDEDGQSVWAFKGEMQFNKAIQKVTSDEKPVAAFTTGHGESRPEGLLEILQKDFEVVDVDLSTEESAGILQKAKFLVIADPKTDIIGLEDDSKTSEYTRLSDYLNNYGSVLLIASPSMPELPVLDEILSDWGMKVVRNEIVMDNNSSVPGNNQMLFVTYPESDQVAAGITGSLTALSSPPRSISFQTAPIEILDPGDGDTQGVEAILTSSDNSFVEVTTETGVEKVAGPFNLMVVSTNYTIRQNTDTYGHILVIGSAYFTESNTYESKYGNTEIVNNIVRLLSNERIPQETDYKVLEDYGITMKAGDVYTYGIITVIVIPLVIFAFGIAVFLKRRHL